MKKTITRNIQKGKTRYKMLEDRHVKRFQNNASRLERVNVRNKNKGKKGS